MLKGIMGATVSYLRDSQWSRVKVRNTIYLLATAVCSINFSCQIHGKYFLCEWFNNFYCA